LHVLPAGKIPSDPGEFVATQRLALVLQDLRQHHDFVLIDAPPILAVGDAVSISMIADALFVVVRPDVIDRPMLKGISRALSSCPCTKLGYVLTNVGAKGLYGTTHYGHYGHYGRVDTGHDEEQVPLPGVAATRR